MENNKHILNKDLVNRWFITSLIVGTIIGPGAMRLPNVLLPHFRQSTWIGTLLGGIYPLTTIILCLYITKNINYNDFLEVSKKFFGNLFGPILYFIFMSQWLIVFSTVANDLTSMLRIYIASHLSNNQVIILLVLVSAFSTLFGLRGVSKGSYIINILFFFIILISINAFKSGSKTNLLPIFDFNFEFKNILDGTIKCFYYYSGFEIILIIYPFVKSHKDLKYGSYMALSICILVWTWIAFITMYYLGVDVANKTFYSLVFVYESIRLPIVNSTRHITMFCWTLIVCRLLSIYYYLTISTLNKIIKLAFNDLCLIFMPISFLLIKFLSNSLIKDFIMTKLIIVSISFNLLYLSILSILIKKSKIKGSTSYENT